MATLKATLKKGLTVGEKTHTEAEIREATAADLIEATEESEKVVLAGNEWQLLASPTLVALNTLRRQVVRVGEHKGPLTLVEMKLLSAVDLSILQEAADTLETAALGRALADRGRGDAGGGQPG